MIRNYDQLIDQFLEVFGLIGISGDAEREDAIELILRGTNNGFLLVVDNFETIKTNELSSLSRISRVPTKFLLLVAWG